MRAKKSDLPRAKRPANMLALFRHSGIRPIIPIRRTFADKNLRPKLQRKFPPKSDAPSRPNVVTEASTSKTQLDQDKNPNPKQIRSGFQKSTNQTTTRTKRTPPTQEETSNLNKEIRHGFKGYKRHPSRPVYVPNEKQKRLLKGLTKQIGRDDSEQVWETYGFLKKYAVGFRIVVLQRHHYEKMINVMAKHGKVEKAFNLYLDMKKANLQPRVCSFYQLLLACKNAVGEGRYIERCFYVLEQMNKAKRPVSLECYNVILQVCSKHKDLESTKAIFQLLKKTHPPDISTFTAIASHFEPNTEPEVILGFWESIQKQNQIVFDLRAYNILLRALGASTEPMRAIKFYHEVVKPKYKVGDKYTFDILLGACLKRKERQDYEIAHKIIKEELLPAIHVDTMLFNSILRVYSRTDYRQFLAFYNTHDEREILLNPRSVEIKALTCLNAGDIEEAKKTLEYAVAKQWKMPGKIVNAFEDAVKPKESPTQTQAQTQTQTPIPRVRVKPSTQKTTPKTEKATPQKKFDFEDLERPTSFKVPTGLSSKGKPKKEFSPTSKKEVILQQKARKENTKLRLEANLADLFGPSQDKE